MQASSSRVHSSQSGVHPGLPALVKRHASSTWRKPVQQVDLPALDFLDEALDKHSGPVVLDSFCGTGQSTAMLAARHDDALVIGVDKSSHRLNRRPAAPDNCVLLQAHCEAVWRHLVGRQQKLLAHYLLYPNPWPKPGHLSRRVHGHPAFPLLLALGGQLELRSNWQLYVEEFGVALHLCNQPSCIAIVPLDTPALTLFEHKYRESGHQLWSVTAKLS
ncbi:SAM-dependent methyltransferase [Congregibacter sp.]|nr:SAM-dependent methyltransferase [Congregibacter sp.]MDA8961811.1 SAM-dependent methyltransferase [Congregibacter sp.]